MTFGKCHLENLPNLGLWITSICNCCQWTDWVLKGIIIHTDWLMATDVKWLQLQRSQIQCVTFGKCHLEPSQSWIVDMLNGEKIICEETKPSGATIFMKKADMKTKMFHSRKCWNVYPVIPETDIQNMDKLSSSSI